jgi:ABC-2 type transport system ATP-binding protein
MQLEVCRLEKVHEGRTVLSIERLSVSAGEIVAVVGPLGSGKTLLLRTLAGHIKPGGGSVTLDGRDIYRDAQLRARIAMLFCEDLCYERLNPHQQLSLLSSIYRLPASRVDEVLSLVGLSDQARQMISKLPCSAKRRLSFAQLLLADPALALLDEPVLRVDWDTSQLFARLIQDLAARNCIVILSDKDLAWAGKFCTRVLELEDGRVSGDYSYAPQRDAAGAGEPAAPERHVPYKVTARREDRIMLYDPGEVLYATSRDGRTILRTVKGEEATTNLTLQELESRLSGRGFFKAHRAYLVNLQHIKAVIQFTRNSYTLQLTDPQESMIPLSKQSEKELQALLGY